MTNSAGLWEILPLKNIDAPSWRLRVLFFNPSQVPALYNVKPYNRHQIVSMKQLWPKISNLCGCGCGKKVVKPRSRWATDECEKFAVAVRFIIAGHTGTISSYMRLYHGWVCSKCSCNDKGHDMGANGIVSWIKIDHIIPVKLGGGGCWLSNYQLLCHDCHVPKTKKDFNWGEEKLKPIGNTLFQ